MGRCGPIQIEYPLQSTRLYFARSEGGVVAGMNVFASRCAETNEFTLSIAFQAILDASDAGDASRGQTCRYQDCVLLLASSRRCPPTTLPRPLSLQLLGKSMNFQLWPTTRRHLRLGPRNNHGDRQEARRTLFTVISQVHFSSLRQVTTFLPLRTPGTDTPGLRRIRTRPLRLGSSG